MEIKDFDLLETIISQQFFLNPEFSASTTNLLEADFFERDENREVFIRVKTFLDKNGKLPNVTEASLFFNPKDRHIFMSWLTKAKAIEKNYETKFLFDATEKFIKQRKLKNFLLDTAKNFDENKVDYEKALKSIEDCANTNLSTDLGFNLLDGVGYFIEELKKPSLKIPTGWSWLDRCLSGGFERLGKALYVFMGKTNVGKSVFLSNLAFNAVQNDLNVLIVSLEMSELIYAKRIAALISGININRLHEHEQILQSSIEDLKAKVSARVLIKEFPPSTLTPQALGAFIKKLKVTGFKPDIIFLDYINLLKVSGEGMYEKGKSMAEEVRALSYLYSCPIITVTQTNRSGYQEKPDLSSISESYALASTADAFFPIWQSPSDRDSGIIHVCVEKNRFGDKPQDISMRFNPETLNLSEMSVSFESEIKKDSNEKPYLKVTGDTLEEVLSSYET